MWVRLDEGMPLERQHRALSDSANWLLVCMVAYSNREYTDGAVERGELGIVRPGADGHEQAAALDELEQVGAIEPTATGWRIRWLLDLQPTADEARRRLELARQRQRRHRESKLAESDTTHPPTREPTRNVTRDKTRVSRAPVPDPIRSVPRGEDPRGIEEEEQRDDARPEPSPAAQIREHEQRYTGDLTKLARQACALSRRDGRMSDAVWARTLVKLSAFDRRHAESAMRLMAERYGDGSKNEKYMLGIARREAETSNGSKPARTVAQTADVFDTSGDECGEVQA